MFDSAAEAVQCAIDIQDQLRSRNEALPSGGGIPFRIGVHLGEVREEEGKVLGDGVQAAARLEGLAGAGGICISGSAYLQVKGRVKAEYDSL
jgi:class 3 adenylate cyclase